MRKQRCFSPLQSYRRGHGTGQVALVASTPQPGQVWLSLASTVGPWKKIPQSPWTTVSSSVQLPKPDLGIKDGRRELHFSLEGSRNNFLTVRERLCKPPAHLGKQSELPKFFEAWNPVHVIQCYWFWWWIPRAVPVLRMTQLSRGGAVVATRVTSWKRRESCNSYQLCVTDPSVHSANRHQYFRAEEAVLNAGMSGDGGWRTQMSEM